LRPPCEEAAPARTAFGEPPEWLSRLARQYLRRYGVVFRDLLAREPRCPPWRELARIYRRMEARGELRGGRFAQAFSGEQFALPEALDALRTVRRTRPLGTERVTISAADPLNLIGILTPGSRVPAQSGAQIEFIDGVPRIEPQLVSA
jgi:ATP-dependent Lhr-like helicase